jgi:hypothetical protein
MIDHGVIFDAPIITQGFPMGDIGMQVTLSTLSSWMPQQTRPHK